MEIKYQENKKMNHHEIHIVAHPKNRELIKNILEKMYKKLEEIEVMDEYRNRYHITILSIYYIEVIEHQIFVYTKDCVYVRNDKIKNLKLQLKDHGFFQANVRTLVNKNHVKRYRIEKENRRIIDLDNGESIVVNRNYKKEFKENMNDLVKL